MLPFRTCPPPVNLGRSLRFLDKTFLSRKCAVFPLCFYHFHLLNLFLQGDPLTFVVPPTNLGPNINITPTFFKTFTLRPLASEAPLFFFFLPPLVFDADFSYFVQLFLGSGVKP